MINARHDYYATIRNYATPAGIASRITAGCKNCDNRGYKSRIALHELLNVDHNIKHLIQRHAPLAEMLSAALIAGMHSLKQDGIEKVLAGYTDIEIVRVVCT